MNNWYRKRKYLHFDRPVSYAKALEVISNKKEIAQHSFFPFLSFSLPKNKFKLDTETNRKTLKKDTREIKYASHMDAHIYSYYNKAMSCIYEKKLFRHNLGSNVLAFRKIHDSVTNKNKSNIHFAYEAFLKAKNKKPCGIVTFDLSKFFDKINHTLLKKSWCSLLNTTYLPKDHYSVYKSLTKYSYVDKNSVFKIFNITQKTKNKFSTICSPYEFRTLIRNKGLITTHTLKYGIPQGSPLSGLLSNIYMFDFDLEIKQLLNSFSATYYRYCDDILIISPVQFIDQIEKVIYSISKKYFLTTNPDKTTKATFTQNSQPKSKIQYLGFEFDGTNIYIRSSSFQKYFQRYKKYLRKSKLTAKKHNIQRRKKGQPTRSIYRKTLCEKFTSSGKSNFMTYGYRASKIMHSESIRKQLKPINTNIKEKT